jgi:hypothetical protein
MSGRVTLAYRLAAAGGWLAFVWATTHWYSWQQTIDLLFGSDAQEYETIAKAAPGFPDEALPSQHANRFVPHYLVGLGSDGFHVGVRHLYYVCAFILLLAILVVLDRLLRPFGLGRIEWALCIGALIANPYLYRFLALAPGRLADSVFIIGGALALLGLLRANPWLLVGGLVVATLGRSESVFSLAVLAPLGVLVSPDWRPRAPSFRRVSAAAALLVPLGVYGLIVIADDSFSRRDHPGFWGLTIFGDLRDLPGSAGTIGLHGSRVVIGVVGAAALIVGVLVARWHARAPGKLPFAFWASLVAGIAVSGEALILSPGFIHGNSPLLSALGAVFFVVTAGAALQGWALSLRAGAIGVIGLAVVSLHHRFSTISPVSTPGRYAGLAAVAAAAVAVAVAVGARPRRAD